MEKFLDIRDLNVEFKSDRGTVKAVNHVSFHINKGETIGLVGETGAGKTTTALSIMKLVPGPHGKIKSGEVLFEGEDLLKKSEKDMRRIRGGKISRIFQDPMTSLNPVMTIGAQVEEAMKIHSRFNARERKERALQMMQNVELPNPQLLYEKYPHQLSGGMRQRVMIAAALVMEPKLLIADEPTTALDVTIQVQILKLLQKINREQGTAVLFISHDLGVIRHLCSRVIVMNQGKAVEQGDVQEIFRHPSMEYTRKLLAAIPNRRTSLRRRTAADQERGEG